METNLFMALDPCDTEVVIQHKKDVCCAAIQPAGYFCASGDKEGKVRVWALDNVQHTLKLEIPVIAGEVRDLCWTGDSKRIVAVGNGKENFGYPFMWDTGTRAGIISGHSDELLSCAMKPQRPFRLTTVGADFCVNFFKGPPFKLDHSMKDHNKYINCVRYAPNGEYFGSVSSDKSVNFYEGKEGKKLDQIKMAHKSSIYGIAWSPDSSKFITCSADKSTKLWDYSSKKCEKTFTYSTKDVDNIQLGVFWSEKNGPISIALNGDINFLDENNPSKPKRTISGHNSRVTDLHFDAESKTIFTSSYDGVVQWDPVSGPIAKIVGRQPQGGVNCVCVCKNDVIVGGMDRNLYFVPIKKMSFKEGVKKELPYLAADICSAKDVIYIATARCILVYRANKTLVKKLDISYAAESIDAYGDKVVVGGKDKKVHIYKFANGKLKETKVIDKEHDGWVKSVKFSKDGSLLATGDSKNEIFVWDANTYEKLHKNLVFHSQVITMLDWKDNNTLVSCSQDKTVIIWNLQGKKRKQHQVDCCGVVGLCLVDDNTLATFGGEYSVKIWKME